MASPHNRSTAPQLRCKLLYKKYQMREREREVYGQYLYVIFKHDTTRERNGEGERKRKIHQVLPDLPAPNILSMSSLRLTRHLRVSPTAPYFVRPAPELSSSESFDLWKTADRFFGRPQRRRESPPAATSPCPHNWTPTWHERMAECECIHKKPLHTMAMG